MEVVLEKVAGLSDVRKRLIQRFFIWQMLRRGMITEEQAKELRARDWQSFLEWLLENAPEIIELIMMLIALF